MLSSTIRRENLKKSADFVIILDLMINVPFFRRKAKFSNCFPLRISVDGRPNRRNKAAILNFSGAAWTEPKLK